MAKTLNVLGHGLASLGVALLMLTCFLVPQHRVLGDDGGPGTVVSCPGNSCDTGCRATGGVPPTSLCLPLGCTAAGCTCAPVGMPQCGDCICKAGLGNCECGK